MKLKSFRITHYKSVEDSNEIVVNPSVTCLVGKNESGKTAVLQALRRLWPTDGVTFNTTKDYPRRHYNTYMRTHETAPHTAVAATFSLTAQEVAEVERVVGKGTLKSNDFLLSRDYKNNPAHSFEVDERKLMAHLVASAPEPIKRLAVEETTLHALSLAVKQIVEDAEVDETLKGAARPVLQAIETAKSRTAEGLIWDVVEKHVPKFLYFGQYDVMMGDADLALLASAKRDAATEQDKSGLVTLLDLLDLADIEPKDLQVGTDYEDHKAKLEATANAITDEAFQYWSQNKELEVEFDVSQEGAAPTLRNMLHVRVKNRRHRVTVPFSERSQGFVWFFSFLAKFNRIAREGRPLVILLDEPGLALHASAQADFLRFIDEKLAPTNQVIYTTHSPFMIDAAKLDRVRTVEDLDSQGTRVSSEALAVDPATAFPLQAALGYSLAQTLFLGPNCLLVEGPSDLVYLRLMSEALAAKGRTGLDDAWVVTPVEGSGRLAAFVTLLGSNKLNIAVLMDFAKTDQQKIDGILKTKVIRAESIVRVNEFAGAPEADLEDMFDEATYCALVKAAYPSIGKLAPKDLPKGGRLLARVEKLVTERGVKGFNHYRPALEAQKVFPSSPPPEETLAKFESLFVRLNALKK